MKPPFIVAELGASHGGKLETALHIIKAAHAVGADAVKLQTWHPDRMVVTPYTIQDGPWKGWDLKALYDEARTPWEWHQQLFDYGKEVGIEVFSTPFDTPSLEFLQGLNCPMYKIASCEIVDLDLIRTVASTGKPLIMSTGGATYDEIDAAMQAALEQTRREDITLLVCTAAYPAEAKAARLLHLNYLRESFRCKAGLSDHTTGIVVPVAAALLSASMIEKHIRLDNGIWNPDEGFALTPIEFTQMVAAVKEACAAVTGSQFGPTESEQSTLKLRRSLYYARDMKAGEQIKRRDMITARPALGCNPSKRLEVVGRTLEQDVRAGDPIPDPTR